MSGPRTNTRNRNLSIWNSGSPRLTETRCVLYPASVASCRIPIAPLTTSVVSKVKLSRLAKCCLHRRIVATRSLMPKEIPSVILPGGVFVTRVHTLRPFLSVPAPTVPSPAVTTAFAGRKNLTATFKDDGPRQPRSSDPRSNYKHPRRPVFTRQGRVQLCLNRHRLHRSNRPRYRNHRLSRQLKPDGLSEMFPGGYVTHRPQK